ncbi:MAG: heavy metal translocating P-type ATPase [Clostridiales bacterium]|nr:heavy metal translocating P-type ATPase [Clostridiales bacterium]
MSKATEHNTVTYIIEGLDCANCAAKIERKIQAMPQIDEATLTFATKQLKVTSTQSDSSMLKSELESVCLSVEDGVSLEEKSASVPSRKSSDGFWVQNKGDLLPIIIGAVLFTAGMIMEHVLALPTIVLFIIFAVGYLILGGQVLLASAKNISKGQIFDENFLMSIATIAAFCIGDFAEGMGVMLFYRIGELFEHIAVERSRTQIMDAVDMRPETVNLVCTHDHEEDDDDCDCGCGHDHDHEHEHHHDHDDDCDCGCGHDHEHEHEHEHEGGEHIHVIPSENAKVGDILLVRPGDRIPLDGIVVDGESRIDTSPVTGEPVPVSAAPGAKVISGCINQQGVLKIKVEKPLSESMVTKILDSVENAAAGKPKIDKFITKFAKVYTPIVVILAVLTAIVPSLITGNWSEWITTAITFLVISCPCALVISVPLAFFSGIGAASRYGILFKGGLSMEALKNVKAIIMDKTGTITKGNFAVQKVVTSAKAGDISEDKVLALAASCESASTHPIAVSITAEAAARNLPLSKPEKIEELSGMGIRVTFAEDTDAPSEVLCGNRKLMAANDIDDSEAADSPATQVLVAADGKFLGCIYIADTIKPEAQSAIASLKASGLIPAMLTGDVQAAADDVAAKTGIDRVYAQLMPEDKLRILGELREETGSVMFIGDGINDAPVLAGADVGAAMGSGADAAIEAADVVFMRPSLDAIPKSIKIARITGVISGENVVFALAVKLLVLVLGMLGFANIWAAVLADTGVAMLCILNSLRILLKKLK